MLRVGVHSQLLVLTRRGYFYWRGATEQAFELSEQDKREQRADAYGGPPPLRAVGKVIRAVLRCSGKMRCVFWLPAGRDSHESTRGAAAPLLTVLFFCLLGAKVGRDMFRVWIVYQLIAC